MSSDDENGLPQQPRRLGSPFSFTSASLRKRSRGADSNNSSDAPFFSSDDLADASLDNYESPRRKKQYRRNWWEEESPHTVRRGQLKRQAKRIIDSGVFMSSDSSSNEEGFNVEQLRTSRHKRQDTKVAIPIFPGRKLPLEGEERASQIVVSCLEANKEIVDLSTLGLSSLSSDTIRPLRDLICLPKSQNSQHSEEAYQSLFPKLQLNLSNNLLRRVPGELVNLENITVLTLRNNQITELPQSMGKLRNLVELNVACNKLRSLPWELLALVGNGKLTNLNVLPNPLLRPFPAPYQAGSWGFSGNVAGAEQAIAYIEAHLGRLIEEGSTDDEQTRFSWLLKIQKILAERMVTHQVVPSPRRIRNIDGTQRHTSHLIWKKDPIYLESTPITFFDLDGSVPRTSHPAPSTLPLGCTLASVRKSKDLIYPRDCATNRQTSVPSLFELALRACGGALQLSKLEHYMSDDIPESIRRMLPEVREVIEEGGRQCSMCGNVYVVPGAEWIEYWHCAPDSLNSGFDELFLPFLRRTCSWNCAKEVNDGRQHSLVPDISYDEV